MPLTRAQRAALQDAVKRGRIFSYQPRSRWGDHWEPGCHTNIVITRLLNAGYLQRHAGGTVPMQGSFISVPLSYSITDAGREALGPPIDDIAREL